MRNVSLKLFFLTVLILCSFTAVFAVSASLNSPPRTQNIQLTINDPGNGVYQVNWFLNGVAQPSQQNRHEISSSYLVRGQNWRVDLNQIQTQRIGSQVFVTSTVVASASTVIQNAPPVFISNPITTGMVNQNYTYDSDATDPDGDTLTYSVTGSLSMTINAQTGLINWKPVATGLFPVIVSVTDGFATTTQPYIINVSAGISNVPPVIRDPSCPGGKIGKSWECQITVTDNNGVVLSSNIQYSLIGAPSGMTINSTTGLIRWTPSNEGTYTFTVRATNLNTGLYTDRTITIKVTSNKASKNDLLIDSIRFDPEQALAGDSVDAYVTVENTGSADITDLDVKMTVVDYGIQASTDKFDLNDGNKETYRLTLELPSDFQEGDYMISFAVSNDDLKTTDIRVLNVKGLTETPSVAGVPGKLTADKVEVVSTPSLSAYVPTGSQEAKLNWSGIWLMIILILLLIALAAYLVKRMAEENEKKEQVDLDFNNTYGGN